MKEIKIIGGGIAGLALGNALLSRGVSVTLYEKGNYPRHRVCGEFISGVGEETLENLGFLSFLEESQKVRKMEWFRGGSRLVKTELEEEAYGISRFYLDQLLAESFVARGGNLHTQTRYDGEDADGVVWATGKPMRKGTTWLGLSVHFLETALGQRERLEMHSAPLGYVGLSPVEGGRLNATGLFKRQKGIRGKDLFLQYIQALGLDALTEKVSGWKMDASSTVAISGFEFGTYAEEERFVLGDAAQLIPPFVGNGMSMALESAEAALDPLVSYAYEQKGWRESHREVRALCQKKFKRRMQVALHLHPMLLSEMGLGSLELSAKLNLLPVSTLYKLTR